MLIDEITLHFQSLRYVLESIEFEAIISLIMLNVGLSIGKPAAPSSSEPKTPQHKVVLISLFLCYIINPLLTLAFTLFFDFSTQLTLALLLASACLGGRYPPIYALLVRADLSSSLLIHYTINGLAIIATPLILSYLFFLHPKFSSISFFDLRGFAGHVYILILNYFLPVILGISLRKKFPNINETFIKAFKIICVFIMTTMISLSLLLNKTTLLDPLGNTLLILLGHNLLLIASSYAVAYAFRLSRPQAQSITLAGSMINYALGVFIAENYFPGSSFYVIVIGAWSQLLKATGLVYAIINFTIHYLKTSKQ